MVDYSDDDPFNAYGWLNGVDSVSCYINHIDVVNNVLFGMNNNVSGIASSIVIHNYNNCSGYVSGYINGNIGTKTYYGILNGTLTNYTFNQIIPIFGTVSGILNEDATALPPPEVGYTISVKTAIGTFTNNEPLKVAKSHVLDIKSVNTLGRKELSKPHSILGENLDKTTKNVDEYEQFGLEQWQLIEYVTDFNRIPPEIQELPDDSIKQIAQINTRTLLATPKFLHSMTNNLRSFNIEQNENETDINNSETINEQVMYCAFLGGDSIIIEPYKNSDIITGKILLLGPMDNLSELQNQIVSYININGKYAKQISEFKYIFLDDITLTEEYNE